MPNFPTSDPTLAENKTDNTDMEADHAANHNAANDEINAIGAYVRASVLRKATEYVHDATFAQEDNEFMVIGRGTSLTPTFDDCALEIDVRTTVGGHPDGGQPANRSGMWIIGDDQSTAALLKFHCAGAHEIIYVSHPDGTFMFKTQNNPPFNDYQWLTLDGTNLVVRMTMEAGNALGNGSIKFFDPVFIRTQGVNEFLLLQDATGASTLASVRADGLGDFSTKGVATIMKAGVPVDGDWALGAPPDGTLVGDSTNNRIYIRLGGVWKQVGVA